MLWEGHVAHMGEMRNFAEFLSKDLKEKFTWEL
jgi:hypothetical protein